MSVLFFELYVVNYALYNMFECIRMAIIARQNDLEISRKSCKQSVQSQGKIANSHSIFLLSYHKQPEILDIFRFLPD